MIIAPVSEFYWIFRLIHTHANAKVVASRGGICTNELVFTYMDRQGAAVSKGQRPDLERRGTRESRAIPAPDANAELVLSMQVTSCLF
jgi:hypothetical protein